jgi:hypothetical protein
MVDYSKWDHMGSSSEDDSDSGFGLSPRGGAIPLQMLAGDGADLVSALLGQLGIVDLEEAAPSSAAKSSAPVRGLDDLSATESKADDMLDVAGLGGAGGAAAPLLLRHVAPLRELAARSPAELFARAGSDDAAQRLFTRLARMLNDGADAEGAELDGAARVRVLEALGDAARERRKRHLVLGALGELSESFEAVLRDHEVGRRKYGRKVGALHSLMLVALCRVLDYNMGAADLLELVSGDAALAMELVVSVAKGAAYEDLLFVALCRLLCGLTQPDTYAQASGLAEDPGSAVAAAAVAQRMSTLVRHAMSANIVAQMSECLAKRFAPAALQPGRPAGAGLASAASAGTGAAGEEQSGAAAPIAVVGTCEHLATVALLGAVHNVYLFAADGAAATEYRQHLLAATPLCAQVVLPYVARCFVLPLRLPPPSGAVGPTSAAPEAAQAPRAPPTLNEDPLLRAGVLVALKVAVTAAFRLKASHKAAAAFAADSAWLTEALLGARGSFWRRPAHAELLSLLLLLNVNTGSLSPPTAGAVVVGGAPVLGALRRALAPLAKAAQATAVVGGDGTDRERERRRGQLCAIADSVEGVDGGDLPVGRDGAGYAALSELLSSMLGEGDAARAAAELAAPAGKGDAPFDGAVGGASAPTVAEAKAVAVSGSSAVSAKAESKAAQAAAAGGMLDDLPQMGSPLSLPRRASVVKDGSSRTTDDERQVRRERRRKRQARRGKREKGAPQGGGAAGAGELAGGDDGGADTAPERFRCAINGHVMKEPVRSPHGQTFERATIEQWLMRQGSICPFTGNELQKSQLVRAEDLESEIAVFHVRRAMAASAQVGAVGSSGTGPRAADDDDDDDDLYDF